MKTSIIALLILISAYCKAQSKGDNTILVKGVTIDRVINTLLDQGFQIDKVDTIYQTVKTDYKKLCDKCEPDYLLNIRIKDSIATITGKWKNSLVAGIFLNGSDPVFDIINERSGIPKKAFQSMNNFAKSLKGEIIYVKK